MIINLTVTLTLGEQCIMLPIKLIIRFIASCLLSALLLLNPLYASNLKPNETRTLAVLLKKYGQKMADRIAFFQAGVDCYQHKLIRIAYLQEEMDMYFYSNTLTGTCFLSRIYLNSLPSQFQPGSICILSKMWYEQIFTRWNLDAMKIAAQTKKPNAVLAKMGANIQRCFNQKITSVADIIYTLQSSLQIEIIHNQEKAGKEAAAASLE